ncbi:hypothetical protein LINPERHAP2_LOCUS40947 [Linum perenne]
MYNLIPNVNLL